MRITFVLERADLSGGVRVVVEHAKQLQRRRHDVVIVHMPWPPPTWRNRVKSIIAGAELQSPSHLDGSGVRNLPIESITDDFLPDADAVIATWWRTAEPVLKLSPAKGRKFHFIQHYETWGGEPDQVDAVWRMPLRRIVISRWLADLAAAKFGEQNVPVVLNAVDHEQFTASSRGKQATPTVGMLYSATKFKGCDVALAAFASVRQAIPNAKLIAFGTGPVVDQLPLPPGAEYIRNPPQKDLANIYARCDVWLCGSRSEGFHLPPLEAMACRCPVVSTRVGGPLDIITDGVDGFLADDAAGLTDRTRHVLGLSDPAWQELSQAAYTTAGRYSWQDAAAKLEQVLLSEQVLLKP
jgi:glycosyltransferase involved in cell wall biosynthesis